MIRHKSLVFLVNYSNIKYIKLINGINVCIYLIAKGECYDMKPVKKAIIPAAGLGTRFLPVTKAMPKEMLPICR